MKYYICIICKKRFSAVGAKRHPVHCGRRLRELSKEQYKSQKAREKEQSESDKR